MIKFDVGFGLEGDVAQFLRSSARFEIVIARLFGAARDFRNILRDYQVVTFNSENYRGE